MAAGVAIGGDLGSLAAQGIGSVAGLDFLHMGRDAEKQADLLGTDILYDAGYDPRGMPQFFETIQAKYGEGGAQILSDHPNPGNRMQYVTAEIATLPPHSNPIVTTPQFAKIRALAEKERVYNAKEVEAGAWRQSGHYAAVAGGPATAIGGPSASPAPAGNNAGVALTRLEHGAIGLNSGLTPYQGRGFTISYPESWQKSPSQTGGVAFAPRGGASNSGIGYGVIVEGLHWNAGRLTDADTLARATDALVKRICESNEGLRPAGQIQSFTVAGQPANSIELAGVSAVKAGGTALSETDWLVTVARPDGDLNYIIMIAPELDFPTLKPLFGRIIDTFRPQ
jgi:hypothetical protein